MKNTASNLKLKNFPREYFFGNMSLLDWCTSLEINKSQIHIHNLYLTVKSIIQSEDDEQKLENLRHILKIDGLESRHYLQACFFLRKYGFPIHPEINKQIYGILFEIKIKNGFDFLAIYKDMSVSYLNYNNSLSILQYSESSLSSLIKTIFYLSHIIVEKIGVWPEPYIDSPRLGHSRITVLTAGGFYFAEGLLNNLYDDPLCGPIIKYSTKLLESILSKKISQ